MTASPIHRPGAFLSCIVFLILRGMLYDSLPVVTYMAITALTAGIALAIDAPRRQLQSQDGGASLLSDASLLAANASMVLANSTASADGALSAITIGRDILQSFWVILGMYNVQVPTAFSDLLRP